VTNESACALIGQVVDGKYEVLRLVGEGALGAVYEARHLIIGRRIALKILHAQLAAYPEMMERFLQEARVAGSPGHGNLCAVTDLGMTEDGQPFLVLLFLEGLSLQDELVRHPGRLATDRSSTSSAR
jgi:serine/threonine protein kinase